VEELDWRVPDVVCEEGDVSWGGLIERGERPVTAGHVKVLVENLAAKYALVCVHLLECGMV